MKCACKNSSKQDCTRLFVNNNNRRLGFLKRFVNLCQYLKAAGIEADWAVEASPPASKAAVEAAPPAAEAAVEAATRMLEAARLSLVHPHWLTLQLEVRPFIFFR
jgi:hypothetical protein